MTNTTMSVCTGAADPNPGRGRCGAGKEMKGKMHGNESGGS